MKYSLGENSNRIATDRGSAPRSVSEVDSDLEVVESWKCETSRELKLERRRAESEG